MTEDSIQYLRMGDLATGLAELVATIGRTHMTVVEVGSFAGESAHVFLDTGRVDRVYCIDPWIDGYDPSDAANMQVGAAEKVFDALFANEPRVVKVKSTLQQAIASGAIPAHVDLVYVDGNHLYDHAAADFMAARSLCDFLAGHDWWSPDIRRAVADIVGRPPDALFPDTSWLVCHDSWSRGATVPGESGIGDVIRSRFDRVLCLVRPESFDRSFAELTRVLEGFGIADLLLPCPVVCDAFSHGGLDGLRFSPGMENGTPDVDMMLGHYCAVKFARDAGFSNVMVIEDGCSFVRATPMVTQYLRDLPVNSNAALFCTGIPESVFGSMFPRSPWNRWGRVPIGVALDQTIGYVLNRKGIERLTDYFEKCGSDGCKWPVGPRCHMWAALTESEEVYAPHIGLVRRVN